MGKGSKLNATYNFNYFFFIHFYHRKPIMQCFVDIYLFNIFCMEIGLICYLHIFIKVKDNITAMRLVE